MFIPYNEQKHLRWGWKDHDNQPVYAAGQFLVYLGKHVLG